MHYYKFNIAGWTLSTSHLSLVEEAIYFRLINYYYDTEKPIPKETHSVFRRLRLGNDSDIANTILDEFFTLTDRGWVQSRCEENLKEYRKTAKKNKANGAKGGRPRNKAASSATQKKPTGFNSVSQNNPNYKPLTTNHKLETKNQELVDKVKDPVISIFTDYGFTDQQISLIFENRAKNSKSAKSAKITEIIAKSICKQMSECVSLGYTIDTVLNEWHESTWVTIKSEWIKNRIPIKVKSTYGQQSEEFKNWLSQSDVIEHDGGEHERIG